METAPQPRDPARRPLQPTDGRLVRGRRSRVRIQEAARALFRERGFDATTLRAIARRAGMGASSIYRHVRSKEELLVYELAHLQEEAWTRFRLDDDREAPTRDRLRSFFQHQHELLAREPDFTAIALRATTFPAARVSRLVLALDDRTIGLVAEILQSGRLRGELRREVEVLAAARAVLHLARGVRISWANGLLGEPGCRRAIESALDLLFHGLTRRTDPPRAKGLGNADVSR